MEYSGYSKEVGGKDKRDVIRKISWYWLICLSIELVHKSTFVYEYAIDLRENTDIILQATFLNLQQRNHNVIIRKRLHVHYVAATMPYMLATQCGYMCVVLHVDLLLYT